MIIFCQPLQPSYDYFFEMANNKTFHQFCGDYKFDIHGRQDKATWR